MTFCFASRNLSCRVRSPTADPVPVSLPPPQVMSTSGVVAIRFIIQNTHYARLIPIITGQMTSKSREIRRACCEFLEQMLTSWPTQALERHVAVIQEAVRRGVADADSEARAASRRYGPGRAGEAAESWGG